MARDNVQTVGVLATFECSNDVGDENREEYTVAIGLLGIPYHVDGHTTITGCSGCFVCSLKPVSCGADAAIGVGLGREGMAGAEGGELADGGFDVGDIDLG